LVSNNDDKIAVAILLINQLTREVRDLIARFYRGELCCDDVSSCGRHTRQLSVRGAHCLAPQCKGYLYPTYPSSELYTQLLYLERLFDRDRARQILSTENRRRKDLPTPLPQLLDEVPPLHEEVLVLVSTHIRRLVERSAYRYISLGSLFSMRV